MWCLRSPESRNKRGEIKPTTRLTSGWWGGWWYGGSDVGDGGGDMMFDESGIKELKKSLAISAPFLRTWAVMIFLSSTLYFLLPSNKFMGYNDMSLWSFLIWVRLGVLVILENLLQGWAQCCENTLWAFTSFLSPQDRVTSVKSVSFLRFPKAILTFFLKSFHRRHYFSVIAGR